MKIRRVSASNDSPKIMSQEQLLAAIEESRTKIEGSKKALAPYEEDVKKTSQAHQIAQLKLSEAQKIIDAYEDNFGFLVQELWTRFPNRLRNDPVLLRRIQDTQLK